MRIISLVPGATEIVVALGAEPALVGVSHECDYPRSVQKLPRVTWCTVDSAGASAQIDEQVRAARAANTPVIGLDAAALADLRPDLIITQTLCDVCAVADGSAHRLADSLPSTPQVIAMTGRTLAGVMADIHLLGETVGQIESASRVVRQMEQRFYELGATSASRARRPRVLCIEWLDPPYLAGHWVPELVRIAGGTGAAARAGVHSTRTDWDRIDRTDSDVTVVMLCGFGVERARLELDRAQPLADRLRQRNQPVWLIDGNAYTARAGPRLVEAAECIAAALNGGVYPGLSRYC
jgi:iron complex transport system substrate-binding protein